jgi:2-keto-3-deoxy-L-rhamnonate aldolase RhmA
MLRNTTKEKVERGEVTYGVSHVWPTPEMIQFLGIVGYDWVFIDAEHDPIAPERIWTLAQACHLAGMTPFVRVPENTPGTILRYLEAGAMGIIIPHMNTPAQARAAVDAMRYYPEGHRGAGAWSRVANFGMTQPFKEYFDEANETVWVWGLIEEIEAVNNLDEILAVEGLDVLGVGPGDLAMSLGLRGQSTPEVREMVEDTKRRIVASGKHLMTLVKTPEEAKVAVDMGSRMIFTHIELVMSEAVRGFLGGLKDAVAEPETAGARG